MPINIQFQRDADQAPRASVDAAFEIVAVYLEKEIGANYRLVSFLISQARAIASGEEEACGEYGNYFNWNLSPREVVLEQVDGDGAAAELSLSMSDYLDVLMQWQAYLFEGLAEPIRLILTGLSSRDPDESKRCYSRALPLLSHEPGILSDDDGYTLHIVIESLLKLKMNSEAKAYTELLLKVVDADPEGDSAQSMLPLAQQFTQLGEHKLAEKLYRGSCTWIIRNFSADTKEGYAYIKRVGDVYVQFLKKVERENGVTEMLEQYREVADGFGHLHGQLMRATGLYGDLIKAAGMGDMIKNIRNLMHGGTAAFEEDDAVGDSPSMEGLEARLRSRIFSSPEATELYEQVMEMMSDIESRMNSLMNEDCDTPELRNLVEHLVSVLLERMRKIRVDEDQEMDMSPPSVSYSELAVKPETIRKLIEHNRKTGDPAPGTPNAEPVIQWSHYKNRQLYMLMPELARKFSNVGGAFIINFDENESTALKKYADGLESELKEKPQFLVQCFTELAAVYELENRPDCAALFKARLEQLDKSAVDEDDSADVKMRGLEVFVPKDGTVSPDAIYRELVKELMGSGIEFTGVENTGPTQHRLTPGKQCMRVYVDGPDMNAIERMVRNILMRLSPKGVVLQKDGKAEQWSA